MSEIPKIIFQTQKSQQYVNQTKRLLTGQQSWKALKDFEYRFFDDNDMDRFMLEHFDEKVNEAYNRCPIPVMKADIWRYCVIYIHGGIYADMDTIYKKNIKKLLQDNVLLVMAPENSVHLCQWLFSAPPRSPILKSVIDLIVKRFEEMPTIKGAHVVHHLTGPGVFTEGIESYLKDNGYNIHKNKQHYVDSPVPIIAMMTQKDTRTDLIQNLNSGAWSDGWTKQREKMIPN
jgi:mannosyltransferase OCH1-like enzyme